MVRRLLWGLALWLIVAFLIAVSGVMRHMSTSVTLAGGATLAVAGFLLLRRFSWYFREMLRALDPAVLTLLHASRVVGGTTLLWLTARGAIPGTFGIPAGVGDIVAALSAPLVAYGLRRKILGAHGAWLWHIAGLLHLFAAVTLASLTSQAPGVLVDGSSSQILNHFPFAMIPAFVGPVLILSHLAAISNLGEVLPAGVSAR
jgi:hypothetical protein